jgi:hypothetical protein
MNQNIDLSQLYKYLGTSKFGRITNISFAKKIINGLETDQDCICFSVETKLSPIELQNKKINLIPKKITFDGTTYPTDIVIGGFAIPQACTDCDVVTRSPASRMPACGIPGYTAAYGCSATSTFDDATRNVLNEYRRPHRPVVGGISVTSIEQPDPEVPVVYGATSAPNLTSNGTLGFIAVDSLTKTLVGVSNSHVMATKGAARPGYNAYYRTTANKFQNEKYDFRDLGAFQAANRDFASWIAIDMRQRTNNVAYFHGLASTGTNTYVNLVADYWNNYWRIGTFKRYIPYKLSANTVVDCAIFDLSNVFTQLVTTSFTTTGGRLQVARNAQVADPFTSWTILGFPHTQRYFPFATTQEINNLINISTPEIFIAGRSSGARGLGQALNANLSIYRDNDCQFRVAQTNFQASMLDGKRSDNTDLTTNFNNCLRIVYRNCSQPPLQGGDSGSAVLANINGIWKIIGLVFASVESGTLAGSLIASRIDEIAPLLQIEPYMGQPLQPQPTSFGAAESLIIRNKQSLTNFIYNGKTYFQAGLTDQAHNLSSIP